MPNLFKSATAAHVLPLAVFMILNALPGWLRIENPELPWYDRAPEQWVYPLQTLLCGSLLFAFRSHYRLAPWRSFSLAVLLAGLGITLWIAPSWLFGWFATHGDDVPSLLQWAGVSQRKGGFDPTIFAAWPNWESAAVSMRFVRLVVVVPFIEELFWRGFLMRYVVADGDSWQQVPFGTHRWKAFWLVTLMVMLAHSPQDYVAAFAWGALVYWLAVRTKSLGACIFMHATANLLLGLYVMKSHTWGLW